MAKNEQEVEAKFLVRDLAAAAGRLEGLGARITAGRVRETNLRFDTPDGALARQRQVLRLRQDAAAVMTFKGPARAGEEVSVRQEIEFTVSDFEAARRLLESLGYQVAVIYEKFRTTYTLGDLTIVLDEMPYGDFIEIEGPDAGSIHAAAVALQLDWEARSAASYLALFEALKSSQNLSARHLTFEELNGAQVDAAHLGLRYAD